MEEMAGQGDLHRGGLCASCRAVSGLADMVNTKRIRGIDYFMESFCVFCFDMDDIRFCSPRKANNHNVYAVACS